MRALTQLGTLEATASFEKPMSTPKMATKDLSVFYRDNQVLKDVCIEIPRNAITVIMGPSGCGKSTFLKTLNRMVELVEEAKVVGHVFLEDLDIYAPGVNAVEIRKRVGMVFQKPNPLPMSIFDNVAYPLRIHGIRDRKVLEDRVKKCLEVVKLWEEVKDRLREPASKLSGGQQQRLCIARALALEPEVLLLDEPTSSLDPISTEAIEELLLELKKNYTIVMVTHEVAQAKRVADYVIFLYLGLVVEQGPAKEVFCYPKSDLTKKFLQGF